MRRSNAQRCGPFLSNYIGTVINVTVATVRAMAPAAATAKKNISTPFMADPLSGFAPAKQERLGTLSVLKCPDSLVGVS